MIQNKILKFSKTENHFPRKPSIFSKKSKTYIQRPQIKKFYYTNTPKSENTDKKYNLKFLKQSIKLKKNPKFKKISKKNL